MLFFDIKFILFNDAISFIISSDVILFILLSLINIFKIIINQYIIYNDEEYLNELKQLFILLISQISLDKDTYHFILSFIINYINKCNNNYI